MGLFFVLAIVIILIIIVVLCLIFIPKPQCFFQLDKYGIEWVNKAFDDKILEAADREVEKNLSDSIYLLFHREINDGFMKYPNIYELLKDIPDISYVDITRIDKKTETKETNASVEFNSKLRCLIVLNDIPALSSGINVNGEKRLFTKGKCIVFDHTRPHYYFNTHKKKHVNILHFDINRPKSAPLGASIKQCIANL